MKLWNLVRMSVLALPLVLAACEGLPFGGTPKTEETGPAISKDDVVAVTSALVATTQLAGVTLDPENPQLPADAAALAANVEARAKAQAPCADISRADKAVTIDFKTGCSPANTSVLLVGKSTAAVSVEGGTTGVLDFTLDGFGANGKTATGGATIKGTPDSAKKLWKLDVAANLTAGTATVMGGVESEVGQITVAGAAFEGLSFATKPDTTVQLEGSQVKVGVTALAVLLEKGACYPSHGSIEFNSAGVKTRIEFSAETKTSGKATLYPPLSKKGEELLLPGVGWKCK